MSSCLPFYRELGENGRSELTDVCRPAPLLLPGPAPGNVAWVGEGGGALVPLYPRLVLGVGPLLHPALLFLMT